MNQPPTTQQPQPPNPLPIQQLAGIPRPGDEFEVLVETLNADGEGQCTVQADYRGETRLYTLRVRHSLPGDRWRVRVKGRKSGDVNIKRLGLVEPSPLRQTPRCKHFGEPDGDQRGCGGCTLQHMGYEDQLVWKAQQVRAQFEAFGLSTDPIRPILGHQPPWHYRNKMEFSFGFDSQTRYAIGLHPGGFRHNVLRLDSCEIFSPWVAEVLPTLRAWFETHGTAPHEGAKGTGFLRSLTFREGKKTGERMLDLLTSGDAETPFDGALRPASEVVEAFVTFAAPLAHLTSIYWTQQITEKGSPTRVVEQLMWGEPAIHEVLALPGGKSLRFEIHPRAFFQPNPAQAEHLYALVIEGLIAASPNPDALQTARALDLYCGTGTISLCLAPYAAKVVGVELSPQAVEGARRNAAYNDLNHVTFFAGDVAQVLGTPEFTEALGGPLDWLVVDPPRAGLLVPARALLRSAPLKSPLLAYVSCNPETLARDLADLTLSAGAPYKILSVQPVDMFPHTKHVECVTILAHT